MGGGMGGGMRMGRGINGDWMVTQEFNGMQMNSILSFSRNQDGMTGQWIGMMGVSDLGDVQFADGQLTFTRTMQSFGMGGGGAATPSTFKGTLSDTGEITGTMSGGPQGDMPIKATRMPRMPRSAGVWALTMTIGDREMPFTLTISTDAEGQPTAKWASERGDAKVSDLQSSRDGLSFKVTSENGQFQWEATFAGTIEGDNLTGALSSEMGDIQVKGQRQGADLIGTWNLDVASEMGDQKQRLVINPDLSALYGASQVKSVKFADGQVSFDINLGFGGQDFSMSFKGTIEDSKLKGELTTPMGSQTVTGTKAPARMGMGRRGPAM